jgi:hypothetical protein
LLNDETPPMLQLLLNSGLLSLTLWLALFTFLVVVASWWSSRHSVSDLTPARRRLTRALTPTVVVAFLAFGTFLTTAFAFYRGYVVPVDILQDIVSAQEFLAGRSLYPDDMTRRMQEAVAREEPRLSLVWWSDSLRAKEADARREALRRHWVQAHPPLLTLYVAPFVAGLGIFGTYAAVSLLSLAALALSLVLIYRGLGLRLSGRHLLLLCLALLCWDPIIGTLRAGQPSLLLTALMVAGWYWLRQGRPVLAGSAVGLAASLKLYPGLLIFYLLLRHRKAFVPALLTVAALVVLGGTVAGWHSYAEHLATDRGVIEEYFAYTANLSLLAAVGRSHPEYLGVVQALAPGWTAGETQFQIARAVFLALAGGILAAVTWAVLRGRNERRQGDGRDRLDLEYSLFMVLMIVLSPVSWGHYLCGLVLPLAVLGRRALALSAPWGAAITFLGLVVILAVPDTAYTWTCAELSTGPAAAVWCNLLLSLRTFALLAVAFWMARLLGRSAAPAAVAELEPARPALKNA